MYVVPFEDGIYYLRNRQTLYYADIEEQIMANGTAIHQWEFHSGATQKWRFEYSNEGYYTIKSTHSSTSFYLGADNESPSLDSTVVLRSGVSGITDEMRWKFVLTTAGAYKIVSKLDQTDNHVLVTTVSTSTNGADLAYGYYVTNTSYRDEWFIRYTNIQLDTPFLSQQTSMWCWATSAQMLARTLFPSDANNGDTSTILEEQRQAVFHVKGTDGGYHGYDWSSDSQNLASKGGIYTDIAEAAAFLSQNEDQRIVYSAYLTPYDENMLLDFLSDGYPIVRLFGRYTFDEPKEEVDEIKLLDIIINSSNYTSGHVTVITGVEWDSVRNCFIFCVYDPAPVGTGTKHYVTYDELRATCTKSESTYSNWEIWSPTVVVKTEYSNKNIFDEIAEFESPNY